MIAPPAEFVVVENNFSRVVCLDERNDATFSAVRVDSRELGGDEWEEVVYWDEAEWRESGTEAFEAIIGCIARVARGEKI